MTKKLSRKPFGDAPPAPFASGPEAWFWFMRTRIALADGARFGSGLGDAVRPCEPADIQCIVERLVRTARLDRRHLVVLRDFGRETMPPDAAIRAHETAYRLWDEAFDRIEPEMRRKGIVAAPDGRPECE